MDNIKLFFDSIENARSDIIVNATNRYILRETSTINGAIFAGAGVKLDTYIEDLKRDRHLRVPLAIGDYIITPGFQLYCDKIIHILSPWLFSYAKRRYEYEKLFECYQKCFEISIGYNIITFPFFGIDTFMMDNVMSLQIALLVAKMYSSEFEKIHFYTLNSEIEDIFYKFI